MGAKREKYRRFIAGPTLNNSKKKKKLNFFGNYRLMLLNFFNKKIDFFWKLSLNVVENIANVDILYFSFFSRMPFFHFN